MKKVVQQFMQETGYSDTCSEYHGVRKDHMGKGRTDWTFKKPSCMLEDFHKYLRQKGELK